MIVYLVLPILAYMLTGCTNGDDVNISAGIANEKFSTEITDKTVFYGTISTIYGSTLKYINLEEVFKKFPDLNEISFTKDQFVILVKSESDDYGNVIPLEPLQVLSFVETKKVTRDKPYIATTTELKVGTNLYFTLSIGNSTITSDEIITWNIS